MRRLFGGASTGGGGTPRDQLLLLPRGPRLVVLLFYALCLRLAARRGPWCLGDRTMLYLALREVLPWLG